MRVAADRDRCIGAGLCVMNAEEVFDQDDDGLVVVLISGGTAAEVPPGHAAAVPPGHAAAVPPERAAAVERAVGSCPSGALRVVDG
jgi:ferredoxin